MVETGPRRDFSEKRNANTDSLHIRLDESVFPALLGYRLLKTHDTFEERVDGRYHMTNNIGIA